MPRVHRLDKLEMPDILAMEPKGRKKVMRRGLKVARNAARALAPVRSGRLKSSLTYTVGRGGVTGKVRATKAPHAHLVHDGTKPHTIHATTKEAARSGWRIYHGSTRTAVKHPGARGNPFLVEAAERSRQEILQEMAVAGREIMDEIARGV
jgi:HK97 gp10 family phage protein